MAGDEKDRGAEDDQGAKDEIAQGMSEAGKGRRHQGWQEGRQG
jgi:hypothetical protein